MAESKVDGAVQSIRSYLGFPRRGESPLEYIRRDLSSSVEGLGSTRRHAASELVRALMSIGLTQGVTNTDLYADVIKFFLEDVYADLQATGEVEIHDTAGDILAVFAKIQNPTYPSKNCRERIPYEM